MIKDVLVHLQGTKTDFAVLATGLEVARLFNGHMECLHIMPDAASLLAPQIVGPAGTPLFDMGALKLLEEDAKNPEVKECVRRCHSALEDVYLRRLGSLTKVPVLALSRTALREAALDHRAGFLLSLMDGVSTLEMILDVSGMSNLEVFRVTLGLVQQGVITLG